MSLSNDDRLLLRRVFAWARAEGWRRDKPGLRFSEDRLSDRYGWFHNTYSNDWVSFDVDPEPEGGTVMDGQALGGWVKGWILSVREAVDVLAAKRILPVELSSAYREAQDAVTVAFKAGLAAGAESARQQWAAHTQRIAYGTRRPGYLSVLEKPEDSCRNLVKETEGDLELVWRPVMRWLPVTDPFVPPPVTPDPPRPEREPLPPPTYVKRRGLCSVCGVERALNVAGEVHGHDAPPDPVTRRREYPGTCKGSRKPPKVVLS